MFHIDRQVKCVICFKMGHWDPTMYLCSDPPIPTEHMCPTCVEAVKDATEQKKYLKSLQQK